MAILPAPSDQIGIFENYMRNPIGGPKWAKIIKGSRDIFVITSNLDYENSSNFVQKALRPTESTVQSPKLFAPPFQKLSQF